MEGVYSPVARVSKLRWVGSVGDGGKSLEVMLGLKLWSE